MLESFPLAIFVGTVLGTLSGLGTGGGSLLILWLTLALGMAPQEARLVNLMFFVPSALVACLFRWKQGELCIKKVLPAMIAGSIFAAIFTTVGAKMDTDILKKLFGGLLIFTGLRELLYKSKER